MLDSEGGLNMISAEQEDELRAKALAALKKKRDFRAHVFAYVLVNTMLLVIWATTGAGYFWPIWPLLGWGIGLFFNAWDVYSRGPTERQIEREIERLR
jgi:2TM domain-containing protein